MTLKYIHTTTFEVNVTACDLENFGRQYMISYLSSMSLFCTVSEILSLISQNLKTSRHNDYSHLRDSLLS